MNSALSLKVMRLSRPTFSTNTPKNLSTNPNIPSATLLLPSTFGSIYLGEVFSSYLSINNESLVPQHNVKIKAELQTSTQRFTLYEDINLETLGQKQSKECIVTHEIKELGVHILVVNVSYGDNQSFRKFYKFQTLNPLGVKTKIVADVHLEIQIENCMSEGMFLDNLIFDVSPEFEYKNLSPNLPSFLSPHDTLQYLYKLIPLSNTESKNLGKLDITWRTTHGQTGRLNTSQLTRKQSSPANAYDIDVLKIPKTIYAEESFAMELVVRGDEDEVVTVSGVKSKMSSILICGVNELRVRVGERFGIQIFPLLVGGHRVSGLRVQGGKGIVDLECLVEIEVVASTSKK